MLATFQVGDRTGWSRQNISMVTESSTGLCWLFCINEDTNHLPVSHLHLLLVFSPERLPEYSSLVEFPSWHPGGRFPDVCWGNLSSSGWEL